MSKSIELAGTVRTVGETETIGEKGFKKRMVILDNNEGQYPEVYAISFVQDKVDKLDGILEGSDVEVSVNIRCNQAGDRWFTELNGWKIDVK